MKLSIRSMVSLLIASIFMVLFFAGNTTVQSKKKFTPKDLPAAVRTSFEKSFPNAKIKGADKEVEQGKTMYEVESIDGTTRRDLMYLEDGTVYETEEIVPAKSLPNAVTASLTKEFPKSEIEKAEKVVRGTTMEFEIVLEQGKKSFEVVISDQGKITKKKELKQKKEKKEKNENDEED